MNKTERKAHTKWIYTLKNQNELFGVQHFDKFGFRLMSNRVQAKNIEREKCQNGKNVTIKLASLNRVQIAIKYLRKCFEFYLLLKKRKM